MNEQALQDSYNLFVQQGYNKSIDDFKQLIATNPEALNDSYALFQEEGYNKSIDDYKNLMGVGAQPILKKKEPTTTVSPLEGTSSGLSSEQNLNPFAKNTVGIPQPAPTKTVAPQQTIKPMAEATSVPAIDVTEKAPMVPAIDVETQKLINDENNISTIAEDDGWYSDNLKMVSFLADKIQYLNPTAAAVFPVTTKGAVKFLDNSFRAIEQGQKQGSIIAPATTIEALGKNTSSETIQKYIRATKDVERFGPSKDMQGFSKVYQEEGESFFGVIKGLAENPQALPELVISSMSTMANLPTIAAGASVVGGAATVGFVGGGGVGAIPAALSSIPYAMGTMSAVLENGLTFGELLQEELTKRNLPFTEESVRKVLGDEKTLSSMRIKAASRGAIIGLFDTLTGRLAGKVGAKLLGNTTASKIKAAAAAGGIEMVGGSGGEATARAAIGQKMDKAEILLEGVAELPMAIPSVYSEVLKRPTFKINGEAVTEQTVKEIVENGSGAELATIKFDIKNDNVGYNKIIQDKVVINSIKEDVRAANPDLNEPSLDAITKLEKQLQDLEGNKTQTGKDKSAALRQEIKNIQENQLQEEVKAEVVTEEKPKEYIYYERDGKYFKKLGQDGEEKPITKTTYNFETKKQAELAALETTKTKQDAIQEPSTDESLLRSEQPEVGLQKVGEGNAQPEGPTAGTAEVVNAQPKKEVDDRPIVERQAEAESKIKLKDVFEGVGEYSKLGGSDKAAVPISHSENNGIEVVEYAHPKTGSIDLVVTAKSDNDFVSFYRIYENGKATNKWSSKFENQSRNKEDFKTMISSVQSLLPEGHEYTETTSISTDGLRVWNQQLNKGYELQYDENGNLITEKVAINGDAIVNDLDIEVNKGNFDNIKVKSEEEFKKVKEKLLPYLNKIGLNEENIYFTEGTVKIDLPVLKKQSQVAPIGTTEVTPTQPQEEVAPELTQQQRDIQRDKLNDEVFRAKKNIARAEDTEAAIEEYNTAKKTLADFDAAEEQRRDKDRAKTNVATIIEDEAVTAQRAGYEYKDLYEEDPRLAAIESARDMVKFAESGDLATAYVEQGLSKKEAKAKVKNSIKTSQQDILDLETDIQANPIVSSKTLEVAPVVEETVAPVTEEVTAPAVEEEKIYSSDGKLYEEYSKKKINEAFDNMPFKKFISLFRKHINPNFTRENNLKSNGGKVTNNFSFQEHAGYVIGDGSYYVDEEQFRAFAKDAGIEIPAAPVTETTAAPVVEEEQYIPITPKQVSHEKFTVENSQDVEYGSKTGENGREYEYIAKISVELINDDNGESIGNLVKNIDEEGNVTWNGEYSYEELSEDGFDTKAEAIKGLLDKYNKTQKSEFNKEAKRQAKAAEKEAAKQTKAAEKAAAKEAAKEVKTPTAKKTKAAPAVAPVENEGPTAEDLSPIESMLDLDMEDDDNMARVLRALEKADKALTKRSRTNANDALLGIPLTTIQIVIKAVKVLVKGGMLLRDAIKKVAAENNLSEQKVVDILNTKSLDILDKGKSEMPMSADNVLYDDSEVLPKPDKKVKNSAVAKLLQSVAANFWGGSIVTSNSITPEQEDVITKNGVREAIEAFEASGKNAADWYSKAIETAIAVAGVVHPELSSKEAASKVAAFAKEKDPSRAAQMALRMALAITSQNLNVDANTIYAEEQFEYFKKNGKFDPSKEYGAKAPAISSNLRLANLLIETLGLNEAENFISKDFSVKELEDAFKKATGKQLTIAGLRNDNVNGAAIFGPKIGQGFLQNLMGKFDPVTIDLWMRRTWGRWTGDVVGTGITDERFAKLILSVKQAIKSKELDIQLPKEFSEYKPIQEKRKGKNGKSFWTMNEKFINRIENDLDFVNVINNITKEISAKANTLYKIIHDIPMSKELYNKFLSGELSYVQVANKSTAINERLKEQYKKYSAAQKAKGLTPLSLNDKKDDKNNTIKGWISIQNEKDGRIYNPTNEEISERKPQWGNEAKNIVDDLNPIDVPTNLDRRVITRVVNNIRKGMNEQGYTVTNADVQALLWYPEKDIWAKLRGEKESNLKLSYDDQFIKLAEKRGLGEQANKVAEGIRSRGPESNIPTSKRGGDESVPSRVDEGGVKSIDEVLDLDVKNNDNLESVLKFLDSVDKGLSKRLFGSANDALLAIPLTTIKAVVKSLKLLVKGGMLLRDAIRKVAAENNISQDSVRDILNIAPIQDGFTKLIGEVEAMVRRQTSRGSTQARMTTNVDTLVRNSEVYQNANDAQKKIMEREARGVMGVSPRRAPSIGRILGQLKDITNVSREDKLKIINQIMQLAKDASKDLATEIKGLKTQGKITVNQAANIISRLGKVNMLNETSVSKFVDYMSNVFANAEYADKISNIKKKLKIARVNVKTKLGAAKNLIPVMEKLFAIDPEIIPTDMLEDYNSLVEMMGKRQEVLDLKDIKTVTDMTNSILDKINEEQSQVQELSDRLEGYEKPVLDDNGNIKYADTISAMVKDGTITEQEAELMRKYKSTINPRAEKTAMTEKEIAEEKQALIKELNSMTIDPSKMASVDDRAKASTLKDLLKSKAINKLNAQQLKNLIKVVSAINSGYFPHSAQLAIERLNAINNATSLSQAILEGVPLSFSKLYSKFKSLFTGKDAIQEMVRRNPLYFIDQLFGNFKTKRIFNALFEAAAKAQSLFESNMNKVNRQIDEINSAVSKSFVMNPNKTLMSSYKMMAYMIQQEYLSNPDSKQVNPAHKFLEATIKQLDNDGRNREADMLQEILDKYTTDGSIDVDKMYASFNPTEKSALKSLREINDGLTEKAVHTAGVIRGQRINPLNNYIHLAVINELDAESTTSATAAVDAYNRALMPSTKGKSLIERTGSVNPLNFDVFASVQQGAKSVLMDYYLTEPIRTARKTLAETEKMMAEQGRLPKEKREIFSAIKKAFNEATENFLVNNYIANSFSDEVVNYLTKQGYRAILASAPRFVGELTSNVGYALVTDRNSFMEGIKYKDILSTPKAVDIVNNVKSKQIGRLFHGDSLGGRFIDTSILSQKSGTKGGKLKSTARNTVETIYNRSLKKYKNAVEFTADALISTPDKMVMRPIWFGSFANEFQNITGTKVDFDKIASNDESYMDKYKEAINSATTYADNKSVLAGATDNAYMGILKGTSKPNQSALLKAFNNFNNFMTRFAIYEYTTARTGVYAMVGNGSISKKQGAALLAGVTTRMVVYTMLVQALGALLLSTFSDEPPEEDEKSFIQKFGQSLTSAVLGLFVGRDFGNATKTILNYGLEGMNEKFLTALREGEYDPYKDAIAYSIIPKEKKGQKTNLSDYITVMGGSMGPALKTLDLAIRKATENPKQQPNAIERQKSEIESRLPLEILGNLGYIPLYKDIRKVVISNIYSSLKEEKKSNEIKQEEKQSEQQEKISALKTIIEESNDEAVIKQAKEKINKLDGSTEQKNAIKQDNAQDRKAKEKLLVDPDTGEEYDNESDLKRYNRNLWEQNFGEGSAWYESHKEEKEAESLLNKKLQEIKDREMNYTGKNSDGSVKRFGASGTKKAQRFGSSSKGSKVRRFGS
jgi:hypothetical protein